jgi:DNA-directed RNA polymerase subunit RPC12/RpoP
MNYLLIGIALIGLYLLVDWHAKNSAYICKNCGHKFTLTTGEDFVSPQGLNAKYARCPQCRQRTWAQVISRLEMK